VTAYDTYDEKYDYEPPMRFRRWRKEPTMTDLHAPEMFRDDIPHPANGAGAPLVHAAQTALARRSPMDQIRELVTYLQDLRTVCEALCKATILPPYMQDPANLQLVIGQGLSMGFTVWQAIRASFIIPPKKEGEVARVGYYVDSLVALVRQSDKCRFFRIEETTAASHRVVCARADEPETVLHVFELTRQQAHEAGMDIARWRDRNGQMQTGIKHNWETGPADMLNARNCGRAVKRVFQDVVFGMYTQEELEDIVVADRQEAEVFSAIPRAAMTAKRADGAPTNQENVAIPVVRESSEPHVVPAGDVADPVRSDVSPAIAEGSGDPAWDAFLADIGRFANVDTTGMLPTDVLELWGQQLAACATKATLNLTTRWMSAASTRAHESKTCSDVFAKMREMFAARDREIKAAERAQRTTTGGTP
jgi:hypothetical protein